jgi:hypothetical protein
VRKVDSQLSRKAKTDLAAARNQLVVVQAGDRELVALLGYSKIVIPYDGPTVRCTRDTS